MTAKPNKEYRGFEYYGSDFELWRIEFMDAEFATAQSLRKWIDLELDVRRGIELTKEAMTKRDYKLAKEYINVQEELTAQQKELIL